ncbi:MAG TPA: chromosome segregation protein SMC [Casimicrobiaceae bacterium]|nr:chromosome segregation protein SMC [Casimicrobiaceae bacterium]
MRLTQIKLSGFKSFVDPTAIATPGQLVGIVGPNGCGKSNVIDAVRWVLGESKASALRGESMQDVIFNGAGDRKPVGRASVELAFDNSEGRIGGQWGQYAELSIKRLLARDGDSSYYINNIPVRRRDIYDLFLGTGLGPRAYAIIEQGMISRVVEAKPEELRIFLEEAAGVSKYRERRKETEGRLADTRENLSRVEDIRQELGSQLARLGEQARVATEYRDLETRLKQSHQMLWFAKTQDAARSRERCTAEIATLTTALDALQADVRAAEANLESLRVEHYAAGDALHEKQGAFYAANAEVTRLEQQLAFARDSETRIAQQVAQLSETIAALDAQRVALADEQSEAGKTLAQAIAERERAGVSADNARAALPPLDDSIAVAAKSQEDLQQKIAQIDQDIRVAETRSDNIARNIVQLASRREKLDAELAGLSAPMSTPIAEVEDQLAQENADLASKQAAQDTLAATVQSLQDRQRTASEAWQRDSKMLADLEARSQALAALQAKIGRGQDIDGWLAEHQLTDAKRLWHALDIDRGWEDALEAVLRERLNALELERLDDALSWIAGDTPRTRVAAYAITVAPAVARLRPATFPDSLLAKVRLRKPEIARWLSDGLHGIRCRDDLATALAQRDALGPGEAFVTPEGHLVTAQGVSLFAPDSELHGVLSRQRELDELAGAIAAATNASADARAALDTIEFELKEKQQAYHDESLALASQQRRCHDLELEMVQLKQAAEAAERRRAQIAEETADVARQHDAELEAQRTVGAEIADLQSRLHDESAQRDVANAAREKAEAALAEGHERLRAAELAAQEANFAERSCNDRIAELARRGDSLVAQVEQQQALLSQATGERESIDWTPVEEALQRQLVARGQAEQALAVARDGVETLGASLRAAEEARLLAEQKLDPARAKIQEMQLKEQAAVLLEQQFTEQLTDAHADVAVLPEQLKAWGSARTLPSEIERLTSAIAELGAVNLAALDELSQTSERKAYLDSQAADLTEAMATLEFAIRQIDRESRELLQQTYDRVNTNFARLFPMLFGGGQAKLVLAGEEILDAGVQVIAQPPGKRNTSIHLLSGGEKALTAIALVFALFQINPAPFCLLDEVDAPLDDPNTDRFCRMVRDMAGQTQFLFISHNKITMEMAQQLVGITMPEPGISRVVAVDIAEALEMAQPVAAAE